MTEATKPAAKREAEGSATVVPEAMAWDSRARRAVLLYLPIACFVFILLFPFYWMAITAFKPNAKLYDYKTYNPFLVAKPTLDHVRKLLFGSGKPPSLLPRPRRALAGAQPAASGTSARPPFWPRPLAVGWMAPAGSAHELVH